MDSVLDLPWRSQVAVRETCIERLLEACGEYELRRRLGWTKKELRPYDQRVTSLLTIESTFDVLPTRPIGEGRTPREASQ